MGPGREEQVDGGPAGDGHLRQGHRAIGWVDSRHLGADRNAGSGHRPADSDAVQADGGRGRDAVGRAGDVGDHRRGRIQFGGEAEAVLDRLKRHAGQRPADVAGLFDAVTVDPAMAEIVVKFVK